MAISTLRDIKKSTYRPHPDSKRIGYALVAVCNSCDAATIGTPTSYPTVCKYCGSDDVRIIRDMNTPVYQRKNDENK